MGSGQSNPDEICERTTQRLGQPMQRGNRWEVATFFNASKIWRRDANPPSEFSLR